MNNNAAERAICALPLGSKYYLFSGSDARRRACCRHLYNRRDLQSGGVNPQTGSTNSSLELVSSPQS